MDEAAFCGWSPTHERPPTTTPAGSQAARRAPPPAPAEQIAAFERVRHALDLRAYTWDVWAAAYVVEDGGSDDLLRDFGAI